MDNWRFGTDATICYPSWVDGGNVYFGDPHVEEEMHTEAGCTMLFVQYPGPTTGASPIYEGRFDAGADSESADMDLER